MSSYATLSSHIKFAELPDPTQKWELLERIGEGTYGEVHLAKNRETGERVAVKILESINEVVEEIEEEYFVLKDLSNHPNLPRFHGIFLKESQQTEDQLWLVMELCAGGSVTDMVKGMLKRCEKLDETLIAHILKETMLALQHLHQNHVMHRDIKGHNILLTDDADIKLVDFGVAAHLKNSLGRRNTSVGTPFWMAPEVIACEQQLDYSYDVRCDVWSLGITAIELADGEPPLADLHPMRALLKIPRSPPPTVKNPREWSRVFSDFIQQCLMKDFEKRPTVKDLLQHQFIQQVPATITHLKKQLRLLLEKQNKLGRIKQTPEITTKHGKLKTNRKSKLEPMYFDDLAVLENLDEDVIVSHLFNRYVQGQIYTYIGDILIAVNPFTPMSIYTDEVSMKYRNAGKSENGPHIFGIADTAYQALMHYYQNQCIVISGESGSGKTESANLLVQQLMQLGKAPNRNLEKKILQVNPLLEAFGNAKTGINDNSSRFGKYLEVTFTANGKVTGAKLSEYLLEKSRVISQATGERNFHIFYYLLDGLAVEDKLRKYHLKQTKLYRYLGSNEAVADNATVSFNKEKLCAIQHCFEIIGFKPHEVNAVYSILASILHIGDIDFREKETMHLSEGSMITNPMLLTIIGQLLNLDAKELLESLTTNSVVTRGETILRCNTVAEAISVRDAMAKALYGRLFDWMVNRINALLRPSKAPDEENLTVGILDIFGFENFPKNSFEQLCINITNEQIQYYFNQHIFAWEQQEYENEGIDASEISFVDNRPVLDMFLAKPMGLLALLDEESRFPKATDQSFVEKVHNNIKSQYYIRPKADNLTFMIEHYAGRVDYEATNFLEKNRDYLPTEIIQLFRVSDMQLVRSLFNHPLNKTGNLAGTGSSGPNRSTSSFGFSSNTGGSVIYANDTCSSNMSSSSSGSQKSVLNLRALNRNNCSLSSQTRAQQTVSTYFRYSLMDLLTKMMSGTPHFVRCIKPNDKKVPGHFSSAKVIVQLRYTGVLETTRIRRQGFSHRIPYGEFLKRYSILAFKWNQRVPTSKEYCKTLLEKLRLENWKLGRTKVFLKYYHMEQLSRLLDAYLRKVVIIQACVRRRLACKKVKMQKHIRQQSAIMLQKMYRGYNARKKFGPEIQLRRRSVIALQASVRGFIERRRFEKLKDDQKTKVTPPAITKPCSGSQQKPLHKPAESYSNPPPSRSESPPVDYAATTIQKYFRMWKARAAYEQAQMDQSQQETKLIYFGQQVQHYGEEVAANMRKNNYPVPHEAIKPSVNVASEQILNDRHKEEKKKTVFSPQETAYYESMGLMEVNPRKFQKTSGFSRLDKSIQTETGQLEHRIRTPAVFVNGIEIEEDERADSEEFNTPLIKEQLLADLEKEKRIYRKWWDIVDMQSKLQQMIHNKAKEVQDNRVIKQLSEDNANKSRTQSSLLSPTNIIPNKSSNQRRCSRDYSPTVNIKITDSEMPKVQSYYFGQAPLQNSDDVVQSENRQNVAKSFRNEKEVIVIRRQESLENLDNYPPEIRPSTEFPQPFLYDTSLQNSNLSMVDSNYNRDTGSYSNSSSLSHYSNSGSSTHSLPQERNEIPETPFDFRKVLRKTNWDPTQTLTRHKEAGHVEQVDFRGVLRRASIPTKTILTIGYQKE